MGTPSRRAAGAVAGLGILALSLFAARGPLRPFVDKLTGLADRHAGWAQAILFLLLVEASSAMETLQRVVELAVGILSR